MRQLRAAGVFPWSPLALRSGILAAALGVVCTGPALIDALLVYNQVSDASEMKPGEALQLFLRPAVVFVASTSLAALLVSFFVAVIQTAGAFSWAVLSRTNRRERRKNPAVSLLGIILAFNVACCLAYVCLPKLLKALAPSGTQSAAGYLGELLSDITKLVVVAGVVLAVVLLFVSRLTFFVGLKTRARRVPVDDT
jgi:hypothetical protein